jgi:hypothetical protein
MKRKNRFQSLPFKCNLQRYTAVGLYQLTRGLEPPRFVAQYDSYSCV